MSINRTSGNLVFLILSCFLIFHSCKNDGSDNSSGWFTDEVDNPATSEEIKTVLEEIPQEEIFQKKELDSFYLKRNFAPVWNDAEKRTALYGALENAGAEGLFFEDYHGKQLRKLYEDIDDLNEEERAKLEILFTDAFLEYAEELYYGKLDPKKLNEIWGIERKEKNFVEILENAVSEGKIEHALEDLKPKNPVYSGLKKSLATYKELKKNETPFEPINSEEVIKPGDRDERIPQIAERLKQLGFLSRTYTSKENFYDKTLQDAIKEFQQEKVLITDEILGNSTISELNMGAEQRYNQILANLERWRWYPRDLGEHYILINIPAYKLAVVKNGDTLRTHNVIAGTKSSQTPIFSDVVQYIVINPEWHIPTSIRNNEIIPLAANNPNYLSSRNIYITDSEGNRIDPSSINWSGGEARNYRFTQGAGPANSLGRIKIIYPNKYAIYLHDTPAKAIFNQNARAESHGCVRVEDATALAAYIVKDQDEWSFEKIEKAIASGKTIKVKNDTPIKVYHFYWTAWNKDGETIFTNDVYEKDKEIYTALLKTP